MKAAIAAAAIRLCPQACADWCSGGSVAGTRSMLGRASCSALYRMVRGLPWDGFCGIGGGGPGGHDFCSIGIGSVDDVVFVSETSCVASIRKLVLISYACRWTV
jgi:hypothetical protein